VDSVGRILVLWVQSYERPVKKRLDAGSAPAAFRPIGRKLVGEVLRTSARLEASRNALLGGFGMTGPRLRLMKMIRRRREPRTVSQLARAIGVSRQTLQETVRDLVAAGFLNLEDNAFHRRAPIVVLTAAGGACLDRLLLVEQRWIADLTRGFGEQLLAQTEWVVRCLRERLTD
jgi:DNA-binding MarR family transcriptional regulator